MNISIKRSKLIHLCRRFISTEAIEKNKSQWLQPVGYETNITIYNRITKCTVPLILKNKNVLKWYICGPTVYDSAHIGHAATYVKSDIIRRILSDFFNINVVMVMCITDIDDKIIKRANESKQDIKDLTKHYEHEFFEDMKMLNVKKPDLQCRVTDYMPEIVQFVDDIVSKGGGYVSENGSVYFDTSKCNTYGKLSTPPSNGSHPHKKSASDFSLWKASKENEPSWPSPWGHGRPGWHIECSAIASTVFGNSIDIHSGGIDLAFPHHENEEAQSCCYHGVDQWVNYWLHCGHLFLDDDVKMSKSLKNTISIQEYLKNYNANHFRLLCLLSNYKNGIKFTANVMDNAVSLLKKIEHFIGDCNNYIAGRRGNCNVDEVILLRCLDETESKVNAALANNFNTAQAVGALIKLVDLGNNMLHITEKNSKSSNISAVAAVSNYVSSTFSKFGVTNSTELEDHKMNDIIEHFVTFRKIVRDRALEQDTKDKILLAACDEARANLSSCGVLIKDLHASSTWSIKKY